MFLIDWLFCIAFNENFWYFEKYFLVFFWGNSERWLNYQWNKKNKIIPKGMESSSRKRTKKSMKLMCLFHFLRLDEISSFVFLSWSNQSTFSLLVVSWFWVIRMKFFWIFLNIYICFEQFLAFQNFQM